MWLFPMEIKPFIFIYLPFVLYTIRALLAACATDGQGAPASARGSDV
jgi:hypothetical protein